MGARLRLLTSTNRVVQPTGAPQGRVCVQDELREGACDVWRTVDTLLFPGSSSGSSRSPSLTYVSGWNGWGGERTGGSE